MTEICDGCKSAINQRIGGKLLGYTTTCMAYGCYERHHCRTYDIFAYTIERLKHHNLLKSKDERVQESLADQT